MNKHIKPRVTLGKEWRGEFKKHQQLAQESRYIRMRRDNFKPVSISKKHPCKHLRDEVNRPIKESRSIDDAILKAQGARATDWDLGAAQPEHEVQAFLIRTALTNAKQFGRFHQEFLDCLDGIFDDLIFVTDELLIDRRIRADIVALGGNDGKYFPVFIELKNTRSLKTVKDQLDKAYHWLWENKLVREQFCHFLEAASGVSFDKISQDENAAKKIIIWPKPKTGREAPSVNMARKDGFIVVDFELVSDKATYKFSRKAV